MRPSNLKNSSQNVTRRTYLLYSHAETHCPSPQDPGFPIPADLTLSTSWSHLKSMSRPNQTLSPPSLVPPSL